MKTDDERRARRREYQRRWRATNSNAAREAGYNLNTMRRKALREIIALQQQGMTLDEILASAGVHMARDSNGHPETQPLRAPSMEGGSNQHGQTQA